MMSVVGLDGRPGGLRDPVPRRSRSAVAPMAWYAMPHVLNPRGVVPGGCRRTARAARLLAAHQHQHRPHTSLRGRTGRLIRFLHGFLGRSADFAGARLGDLRC